MIPEIVSVLSGVLGILLFMVCWWRGWLFWRQEPYQELEVTDVWVRSGLWAFLLGRVGYILTNWSGFEWQFWRWVAFWQYPGWWWWGIAVIWAGSFWLGALRRKWNAWHLLDIHVIQVSLFATGLSCIWLLENVHYGAVTKLPWGVRGAGFVEPRHPVQLYWLLAGGALTFALIWFEKKYRRFEWYRINRETAQPGFVTGVAAVGWAAISAATYLVKPTLLDTWWYVPSIWGGASCLIVFGVGLLVVKGQLWKSKK